MTKFDKHQKFETPDWFVKVLPLFGLFVQDRIKKENALLLARITDLENRMSEFQYCGVWHDGAYKRGNFVTHDGSVWHCNADTRIKPGADPIVWTLAVKHGKDYTPQSPTKVGPRPQLVQRRT
jgi:hypothetical protein